MALMKLRDIFEKHDLPGRKSKGEGWRIVPVTRHVTSFHRRDVYWSMSASAYIPDERARAQVYPFSYAPSLRKDKSASSVPVTADFAWGSWKKGGTTEKSTNEHTVCGRIVWNKLVIVQSGRSQVLVCIVFTAHGPSRRTTLLFLTTLITKSRIIAVCSMSGVF